MGIELRKIEEGVEIKIGIVRLQLSMAEAAAVMTVLRVELGREAEQNDEIRRLKEIIERDRTGLAHGLDQCRKTAASYDWICEGRGPYEYDDDRYRMEVGNLVSSVTDTATKALRESGTRVDEAFIPRARLTSEALEEADPLPKPNPNYATQIPQG